jgi:3-oxoacyl-(acyl-carrier-protein) synthase
MNKISITAASSVTAADLAGVPPGQRFGQRFGRLDLQSQLSLLAVESLNLDFNGMARERTGICLATSAGSLSTDVNFWQGRDGTGGRSPTLFAYTLPSAAAGEIAIHFKVTGPNLCFVGDGQTVLPEAFDLIRRGEADGCVCVFSEVVSAELAKIISAPPRAGAWALCLKRGDGVRELREFDRDMKALCALISHTKSAV